MVNIKEEKMIHKIIPQSKINIPIIKKSLQKQSSLINVNGGSIPNIITTMIIPGGITKKESFVYQLTGKMPKSVKDRWYEAGSNNRIPQEGDQEIKFGDHIAGDSDFEPHDIDLSDYSGLSTGDDHSELGDIINEII